MEPINIIRKFNLVCEQRELYLIRKSLRTYMEQITHDTFDDEVECNEVKTIINEIDKVLDRIK